MWRFHLCTYVGLCISLYCVLVCTYVQSSHPLLCKRMHVPHTHSPGLRPRTLGNHLYSTYVSTYCTFSEPFDRVANESSCICVYNSLQWVSMYFVYMYVFRQLQFLLWYICTHIQTIAIYVLLWTLIRIMLCIYKPWVMIHSDVIVDAYGPCGSGNPLPLIGREEAWRERKGNTEIGVGVSEAWLVCSCIWMYIHLCAATAVSSD